MWVVRESCIGLDFNGLIECILDTGLGNDEVSVWELGTLEQANEEDADDEDDEEDYNEKDLNETVEAALAHVFGAQVEAEAGQDE